MCNKKLLKWLGLLFAVALLLAALPLQVKAEDSKTWTVCSDGCDSTTIQGAIDAASAGDTINVAPGTYLETIVITKDNLIIQAVSGNPEDTIIDADGADDSIVDITNRSGVTISGFTIKGAIGPSGEYYGVKMENASGCTLSNSVITAIETVGYRAAGIGLNNATDNNFDSVTVSDINCPGDTSCDSVGVSISGGSDGNSFSSTAVSNLRGVSTSAFKMSTSDSNTVESTTISNLTATRESYGFYINSSDDNSFIDTDISNLIGNNQTSGIRLTRANYNTFSSINISNLEGGYQAFGIFLFQRASNNSFESIEISGVTATGPDASVHGIVIDVYSCNNNFREITIFDITGGSAAGRASGISLTYSGTNNNSFSEYDISGLAGAKTDGISIDSGASSNSFSGGSITEAQNGVHVSENASDNSIHFTKILGNTEYGVKNENVSAIFDATKNWWGCNAGPGGTGCDIVSDNVAYSPWLGAPVGTVPMTFMVDDVAPKPADGYIQTAINAASPGDIINVAAGTYNENVTVDKALTLNGAQHGVTAVGRTGAESIINAANPSVYVVKIMANTVTLDGFTITGMANGDDNQAAVITWGVDHCTIANNILTNNYKDAINLFSVSVQDEDTAYSDYNTVSNNVINGPANHETFGIKIKGSHNTISGNHVYNTDTPIQISSWDKSETVSPDYNTISGNTIAQGIGGTAAYKWGIDIKTGHYNTVTGNTITGAERAAIHFHTSDPMVGETDFAPAPSENTISNNTITGSGAGVGILFEGAEDTAYGAHDNTVSGNTITNTYYGIAFAEGSKRNIISENIIKGNTIGVAANNDSGTGNVVNYNNISGNSDYGVANISVSVNLDATNNWWGCNAGPVGTRCDSVSQNVDYDPWLVLKITSDKQIVEPNEKIQIDANLNYNSDEENTLSDGYVPDGITAEFSVQTPGDVDPVSTETVKGQVSTSFTSTEGGVFNVCVTVDNQTECTDIVIPAAAAVDDVYSMMFNSTLDVDIAEGVTKNDKGITEGFDYTVSLVSGPEHGQLELKADGSFKYIPEANFVGDDTFVYQLVIYPSVDGIGIESVNPWLDQAMVKISVEAYKIFMPLIQK